MTDPSSGPEASHRPELGHAASDESYARAARIATRICADALEVERVGMWEFRENGAELWCVAQYLRAEGRHLSGEILQASTFPLYLANAREKRVIVAADARSDPATRELGPYLERHSIGAMLDAPVVIDGEVIGIVCHEHVGGPRAWTEHDIDFAGNVAELVSLVCTQIRKVQHEARRRIEAERRRQDEKMAAVGRMSQSVLHDLNNVLFVAGDVVSGLEDHADPAVREQADRIERALDLARNVAGTLETLGTERRYGDPVVDLAALLRTAEARLSVVLTGSRSWQLKLPATPLWVRVAPEAIERALLNLLDNACKATADDGHVEVALASSSDGGYGELRVSDDGIGMEPDVRERAFEPYFTSRDNGTGLGLASTYSLVRSLGGDAHLDSSPGHGTVVTLRFPLASPPEHGDDPDRSTV